MEYHDIIKPGTAKTREVGIHSQAVLHRLTPGDHEKDGWQGRTPGKASLNIAGLEEGGSHCYRKGKNSAQMLLAGRGRCGSTHCCPSGNV